MSYQSNDHTNEPFPSMGIMQPDETPVWSLSRLLFAGAVVTIILMTWLAALYYQFNSFETLNKTTPAPDMLGATKQLGFVLDEAQQSLQEPARVADSKTGRIAIPIALAEQRVIAELNDNPEADVTGPPPPPPVETEDAPEETEQPTAEPTSEDNTDSTENQTKEETTSPKEESDESTESDTSTEPEATKDEPSSSK